MGEDGDDANALDGVGVGTLVLLHTVMVVGLVRTWNLNWVCCSTFCGVQGGRIPLERGISSAESFGVGETPPPPNAPEKVHKRESNAGARGNETLGMLLWDSWTNANTSVSPFFKTGWPS